jgi:hypothetical protein
LPCASAARLSASARSFSDSYVVAISLSFQRPGSRVVIS